MGEIKKVENNTKETLISELNPGTPFSKEILIFIKH